MSLPHRVGGALVVLGQAHGEQERDPAHSLTPAHYGPGVHSYFTSYPETTPSNVITKVRGTLGETPGAGIQYTPASLPRNFLNIVCYKTELNHRFPKIAYDREGRFDEYNSDCINDSSSPYYGDEPAYAAAYSQSLRRAIYASYFEDTTVTDILVDPTKKPANLRTLFPRWTDESSWDMEVQPYEDAIQVPTAIGGLYWQTRKAPDVDEAVDFIAPWYVTFDTEEGAIRAVTRIFCDFSYKFTSTEANPDIPIALDLVFPYTNRDQNFMFQNQMVPDHCSWQYYSGYPSDGFRSPMIQVYPENDSGDMEPMKWQSEATHGLFLDADGSCWNLGTVLEVKVYIWKAPPKMCFYPKNDSTTGVPSAFTNWKVGGYADVPFTSSQYFAQSAGSAWFTGRAYGTSGNRHTIGHPGLQYVETGISSGIAYSISEPNPMAIMFWGVCFAPDYASPLCKEHDVLTFTVTLDETNTFACDGTVREGAPSPTEFGYKIADIPIPAVEGYITYIHDYEVISITKAGEP